MYIILQKLGHGAFGFVYLLETPHRERYALKVSEARRASDDVFKEARILNKLCHAHLIKYYASFMVKSSRGPTLYMITEFCKHGTLRGYISQQRKYIAEHVVLLMLCQLSDVLRYLHVSKIIHRDLKPENIFLDKHKNIKVGDVNVARELEDTFEKVYTQAGSSFYMSPEVRAGKKYSFETDIWSAGCCVHEMMTLRQTFLSHAEMYEMVIPDMSHEVYGWQLRTLVLHMLAESPRDRPDAYSILEQACRIRGERYKSGEMKPNINLTVNARAICDAVSSFIGDDSDFDEIEDISTGNGSGSSVEAASSESFSTVLRNQSSTEGDTGVHSDRLTSSDSEESLNSRVHQAQRKKRTMRSAGESSTSSLGTSEGSTRQIRKPRKVTLTASGQEYSVNGESLLTHHKF